LVQVLARDTMRRFFLCVLEFLVRPILKVGEGF
jgi:hypothetical protein